MFSRDTQQHLWCCLSPHPKSMFRMSYSSQRQGFGATFQAALMSDIYSFHLGKEQCSECHTLGFFLWQAIPIDQGTHPPPQGMTKTHCWALLMSNGLHSSSIASLCTYPVLMCFCFCASCKCEFTGSSVKFKFNSYHRVLTTWEVSSFNHR